MDILLVNPNIPSQIKRDKVPNIGVLCIASYLTQQGYDASICDLSQSCIKDLLVRIDIDKPLLIGFSCTSAESYQEAISAAKTIKCQFDVPIIAGGQHITGLMAMGENYLSSIFDCHISGPGEIAIADIIKYFRINKCSLSRCVIGDSLTEFVSLDYTLYPNYENYIPCVEVVRGCNHNCNFCNASLIRELTGYRYRSPQDLREELKKIIKIYGENTDIFLFGPIFGNDITRTKIILRLLQEFPNTVKFSFNMRVDSPWREFIDELRFINIRSVFFGMESASSSILLAMKKTHTPIHYIKSAGEIFKEFSKYNIPYFVSFILGYWGETLETINETEEFIKLNKKYLKAISVNHYHIYPGASDYANLDILCSQHNVKYTINSQNQLIYIEPQNGISFQNIQAKCKQIENDQNTDTEYYNNVRSWRFC